MAELTEKERLIGQLSFTWDYMFWNYMQDLSDEEYFWEPVKNNWSIREAEDGTVTIDWNHEQLKNDPVTTIAWLINHMAYFFTDRYFKHFENKPVHPSDLSLPMTAVGALANLEKAYQRWLGALQSVDDERYLQPCGEAEAYYPEEPFATLVLHINREFIYHAAECNLLRDLYSNSLCDGFQPSPARI